MAPSPIRQLLIWSLPSVAVLLSYLWYKKRKIGVLSDIGSKPIEDIERTVQNRSTEEKTESVEVLPSRTIPGYIRAHSTPATTPQRMNRSLSGVESTPIDIVYPKELKSSKSSPVVISDEDLDLEIKKIKSMRNNPYNSPSSISARVSKTPSPAKSEDDHKSINLINCDKSPAKNSNNNSPSKSPLIVKKESFEHRNAKNLNFDEAAIKSKETPKKKNKSKKSKEKRQDRTSEKMVQAEVAALDEKMTALKISNNKDTPKKMSATEENATDEHCSRAEMSRRNSGRDSANHSPSDVMLASPSLSSMSDNHSEGSSDSGKGGSEVPTPPPSRTPQMTAIPTIYEFVIPQNLAGKLIGRQGSFVQSIKDKCDAQVCVRRHPTNNRLKLCTVEGTQEGIDAALKMIRDKFPLKRYTDITLEQVHLTPVLSTTPLIPDSLYLKLIEGINNDTILSCMVSPNHLFMQLPTHPSYPGLAMLQGCMTSNYNAVNSPLLPTPVPANIVCAAYSLDGWYRVMTLSTDEASQMVWVKFVDIGGYGWIDSHNLRQIRQDFMLLPFQAPECYLANVKPKSEDGTWSPTAYELVSDIARNSLIYTQVAEYAPDGTPLVLCYVILNSEEYICINQKLIDEGHAEEVPIDQTPIPVTALQRCEIPTVV